MFIERSGAKIPLINNRKWATNSRWAMAGVGYQWTDKPVVLSEMYDRCRTYKRRKNLRFC